MAKIKGSIPKAVVQTPEEERVTKTFDPGIPLAQSKRKVEKVLVRCPDCPWKAGLIDENTYCQTCNGSGQVSADPLE